MKSAKTPMPSVPGVPPKVIEAAQNLVCSVNESGEMCVGVVIAVVFERTNRVLVLRDPTAHPVSGIDPERALCEDAVVAVSDELERIIKNEKEPN